MTLLHGWPPDKPFPASLREPVPGAGADFPGSSGGREQGKFRESAERLLTQVAVSNDDGSPVGKTTDERLEEVLLYQKAMVLGLSIMVGRDLLAEVAE